MSTERILIVEDEGIAAVSLETKIVDLGYQSVGIAMSAEEAVEMAQKERPDLILMDIKLNGKRDGIDSAEEIHKSLEVPIVFITAFSDTETLERAKVVAPFGYLVKPYREESVKSTIEIALNIFRLGKKVKDSEQDFRTLFDLSPVGTLLVSKDQVIIRANAAFARLMGIEPGETLEDRKLNEFFIEEDEKNVTLINVALLSGNQTKICEARAKRKDGRIIWLRLQSTTIRAVNADAAIALYIISDISALKEVESQLKEKADILLEANQKHQEFTSLASHDLKAPARITGMYMSLLAMEYGEKLDDRGREFLGFALSESKKMQAIVDDLLEYTKVCHTPSELKPISLSKVVQDTLQLVNPELEEKRASVTYEPLPTIYGSESQLRRLFANIISNAIKFNRSKPKIQISVFETTTDYYTISVSDNGVGISEKEIEDIFEMFHRGHSQSEFPGTGIGLASCKKVVENHQGKIWVKSVIGKGSTFFLSFPIHLAEKMGMSTSAANLREQSIDATDHQR